MAAQNVLSGGAAAEGIGSSQALLPLPGPFLPSGHSCSGCDLVKALFGEEGRSLLVDVFAVIYHFYLLIKIIILNYVRWG